LPIIVTVSIAFELSDRFCADPSTGRSRRAAAHIPVGIAGLIASKSLFSIE
jgi:hypothetical protein